jgi:cation diffusion facilitator family transporter
MAFLEHDVSQHASDQGHSHGLIDRSVMRSREGLRAVGTSLIVLAMTGVIQFLVFILSGSVALLADLIHNFGDALTAVPLGVAFLTRSARGERWAGWGVILAIAVSATVAGYETVMRFLNPSSPSHVLPLALAGLVGLAGNEIAARVRLSAGRRLESPALVADGHHARVDGLVSLGVVASALGVMAGVPLIDPAIGLLITLVILKITWDSWHTMQSGASDRR